MEFWDLLFKRYASPFLILNNLIATGRLVEFINKLAETKVREDQWEFYIHKLPAWDGRTFEQFLADQERNNPVENESVTKEDLETIVHESYDLINKMGDITNGTI